MQNSFWNFILHILHILHLNQHLLGQHSFAISGQSLVSAATDWYLAVAQRNAQIFSLSHPRVAKWTDRSVFQCSKSGIAIFSLPKHQNPDQFHQIKLVNELVILVINQLNLPKRAVNDWAGPRLHLMTPFSVLGIWLWPNFATGIHEDFGEM